MSAHLRCALAALLAALVTVLPPVLRAASGALGDAGVLALRIQVWTQSLARLTGHLDLKEQRS